MESSADRNKFNIGPGRRPAPPPRPSRPPDTQDDLRSSDSDSRSFSTEGPLKSNLPKVKAVIVGGGFAGASLAIALQKLTRLEVTLIDVKDCFVYTPSLFHLLSQPERINSIIVSYKDVLKKGTFLQATVEEVSKKSVRVNGTEILFDYCFICTGMYYMVPGPTKRQKPSDLKTEPSTPSLSADLRKSPRRKRNPLSSSSKHSTFSASQRLKAILKDAIIGPIFSSFVASRPQLWVECIGLQLLKDIKAFNSALTTGSQRHSSSSSSSGAPNRAARKLFTSIVQQYIAPGAPKEVRFASASNGCLPTGSGNVADKASSSTALPAAPPPSTKETTIKEQLAATDPKTVDNLVFKSTRQALISLLTEVALPAFLDAAAVPSTLPLPIHLSSTGVGTPGGSASPQIPGSPLTSSSPGNYSPHSPPGDVLPGSPRKAHPISPRSNPDSAAAAGGAASSKSSAASSASAAAAAAAAAAVSANATPTDTPPSSRNQTQLSASEGGRRRRSASSGHASSPRLRDRDRDKMPTSPRQTPSMSSLVPTPTTLANVQASTSNGSLAAPVALPASIPTTAAPNSSFTSTTTVRSSRLVMEIHEMQYSTDGNPGTPTSNFSSSGVTNSASNSSLSLSSRTASPPPPSEGKGSPAISTSAALNLKYPALIPTLRTLQPMLTASMKWKEDLASIEDAQRIVIVGGDLVAIELAAEIHSKFPKKTITIIHSHRHLIGNMSESVRLIVDNFFKNRQIDVLRKKIVVAIQPFKIYNQSPEFYHLLFDDGTTLEADKVFCYNLDYQHGNTSCLETHFSEFLDGRGFAKVDRFLRFGGTENLFALGDVACLNEYKVAERARAHASLVATNIQRLLHGLELESYRERVVPKTYDLILGPSNGIQIENGRFVRIGPGPVERRGFAERRILHRFGAVHLVLSTEWSQLTGHHSPEKQKHTEDETAGSRGETSSEVSLTKKAKRKLPLRRFSDNANEEDSDELKPKGTKNS